MGETEHPIVPAKKVGQTWVRPPISFIPKGFSLDSAGLTPAGKKDLYERKRQFYPYFLKNADLVFSS